MFSEEGNLCHKNRGHVFSVHGVKARVGRNGILTWAVDISECSVSRAGCFNPVQRAPGTP